MLSCQSLDTFVTLYVDGEIADSDRMLVEEHLRVCAQCQSRITVERAVRALIHSRKPALQHACAPAALRDRCAEAAAFDMGATAAAAVPVPTWRARLAPLALAASLVLLVGGAFLYQLTDRSATVLAAELTADHVKCFAMNNLISPDEGRAAVESAMAAGFGWNAQLPDQPERAGLELVGSRPCLYGEGRVAHIMYRYQGRPVSLFMLPHTVRPESVIKVMGHQCAIWSSGDRTFVLVAREPRTDVERIASFVHASLR